MISLEYLIRKHQHLFAPVIRFDQAHQKIVSLDLTVNNTALDEAMYTDTILFSSFIEGLRKKHNADYLVGGYNELRAIYTRSDLFSANKALHSSDDPVGLEPARASEPRRLHLGTDIWGPISTPVYAFMDGQVHSFAFNDQFGDYGATLILSHRLEHMSFHTLYGHISLRDIEHVNKGDRVVRNQQIAHFGDIHENGHWPPHLHFQVIKDMESYEGDYPGVCRYSEREKYLANCPDPDSILQLNAFLK